MIKIEFGGHSHNVPSEWSEICFGDYENWYMQKNESAVEHVNHIASICKMDGKLLMDYPVEVFEQFVQAASFALDKDLEPMHSIKIAGETYFIAPADKLSLAEWVDVDALMNNEEQKSR